MRAVVQRVTRASVTVVPEGDEGAQPYVSGSIGRGYLVLLGVGHDDTEQDAGLLWDKIRKMRVFADASGKTNFALADVGGEVLVVSQFTLYADCRHGNRPSFTQAGAPDRARELYEHFCSLVARDTGMVQTGEFGADMRVELVNDGPFTICLDMTGGRVQ